MYIRIKMFTGSGNISDNVSCSISGFIQYVSGSELGTFMLGYAATRTASASAFLAMSHFIRWGQDS
jgi:hypothetical protein